MEKGRLQNHEVLQQPLLRNSGGRKPPFSRQRQTIAFSVSPSNMCAFGSSTARSTS